MPSLRVPGNRPRRRVEGQNLLLRPLRQARGGNRRRRSCGLRRRMIRKRKSGQYRLYSRKISPKTGKRRHLGIPDARQSGEARACRPVLQASGIVSEDSASEQGDRGVRANCFMSGRQAHFRGHSAEGRRSDALPAGLRPEREPRRIADTAIGALRSAKLAFFDRESKQYRPIPVEEQVEIASLVAIRDRARQQTSVHVHAVLGARWGRAGRAPA